MRWICTPRHTVGTRLMALRAEGVAMVGEQTIDVLIGGYLSAEAATEDYEAVS